MSKRMSFPCAATVLAALCMTPAASRADDRDEGRRADPAIVAARQKIFGLENVDARTGRVREDKVIFSWITNASFAASVRGRIILLDTFVSRLEVMPGRTPLVIKDLVDARPEALFVGHGHGDHADNAATFRSLPARSSTPPRRPATTCSSTRRASSAPGPA